MSQPAIAIIGAGFSGLAAALELEDHGHRVTVFEARDRPGGRVWSQTLDSDDGTSEVIERGAEFIIDGYTHLGRLAERFNLDLIDTGMSYYRRVPVDYPNVSIEDLAEAGQKLTAEMTEDQKDRPVVDLLAHSSLHQDVAEALTARIEISAAIPVDMVPGSALEHVASFKDSPSWRIQGGNQRLADSILRSLSSEVRFNTPVRKVRAAGETINIDTDQGTETFDRVIVALPLQVIRDTSMLQNVLTQEAISSLHKIVQGQAAKFHALLEHEPKESATMSVAGRYWCWTARTSSSSVGKLLSGFIGSSPAISRVRESPNPAKTLEEDCKSLRSDLSFNERSLGVFTDWEKDEFAQGAYSGRSPGVADLELEPLRHVHSHLSLAGEYLGGEKIGLMEGAIRSGQAAAQKTVTALS